MAELVRIRASRAEIRMSFVFGKPIQEGRVRPLRAALIVWLVWGVLALGLAQDQGIVKEVVVRGNREIPTQTILAVIRTAVDQPFRQTFLDEDRRSVEDMGSFKQVDVKATPLAENEWRVEIDVVEWDRILEIRIVGNDPRAVPNEDIIQVMSLKVGEIFNLRRMVQDSQAIEELFSRRGYFAQVRDLGPLEDSPNTLNVAVIPLRINEIVVEGNSKTSPRVINRLIKSRPGELLNIPKWQRDLRRMFETQWFDSIEPSDSQPDTGLVNLKLNVQEARTGTVDFGVQVDPRNRVAGLLRFRDSNFRGSGQYVGVEFLQATTGRGLSVSLDYANPFLDALDTSLSVSVYSRETFRFGSTFGGASVSPTGENYSERRTGGAVGLARPLDDTLVVSANARFESIRTEGAGSALTGSFIQQDGDLGVFGLGLTWDRRDVAIDPSRGSWFRISLEPGFSNVKAIGGLTSDTSRLGRSNFLRGSVEYRAYYSPEAPRERLDDPRRVFAFRARYGQIGGNVPFFEQFFMGGSNTLRGYADDRFWGKQMAGLTLEYRHPVQRSFYAIGHIDYGGAWGGYPGLNEYRQYRDTKFNLGYGIGFSFRTPLGPIRLDFSFNDRGGSRTHFIIGSSF